MCLVSVLPKGTEKLSKEVESFVDKGITTNDHGSGIMWKKNGTKFVNIKKGLNSFDAIMEAIEKSKVTVDDELVIHHRIGTCGEKTALNTHPFLVSPDKTIMENTSGKFQLPAMAHNGIFHAFTNKNSRYNDTFHFVNEFLALPGLMTLLKEQPEKFRQLFSDKIGFNRLAFLFPDRDVLMLGDFVKCNGYFHSNDGFKEYVRDEGGSSFSNRNKGSNNCITRNLNPPEHIMSSEEIWAEWYDEQERIANMNKIKYGPKAISTDALTKASRSFDNERRQIVLYYNDIMITENNAHHFMFALIDTVESQPELRFAASYATEGFENGEKDIFVFDYPKGKDLLLVNSEEFLMKTKYHVKKEFEVFYNSLDKLNKHTNGHPSKSLLKKMNNVLSKNWNKKTITFKDYGVFTWGDLNYYYSKHSKALAAKKEVDKAEKRAERLEQTHEEVYKNLI